MPILVCCALLAAACGSSSDDADTDEPAEGSADADEPSDDANETDSPRLEGYAASFDQSVTSELYRFADGEITFVGQILAGGSPVQVTDLALADDGTIYATTFAQLLTIDPVTAEVSAIGSFDGPSVNSLAVLPDGQLLAADSAGGVAFIDRSTAARTPVATFPSGLTSSGDIVAMPNGMIYATATDGDGDYLLTIDPATGLVKTVSGSLPNDIYGLMASDGGDLYGLAFATVTGPCARGEMIRIDIDSGDYESVECLAFSPGGAAHRYGSVR